VHFKIRVFNVDVIRCVAIAPSDANCQKIWIKYEPNYFGRGGQYQRGADTLIKCQQACELDPRCVSIDWQSYDRECWISTNPNHLHYSRSDRKWVQYGRHHLLVRHCSTTTGQCRHDLRTV